MFTLINQSEISISIYQPIRDQYFYLSTNQRSVLILINQSEISIYINQPIRNQYLPGLVLVVVAETFFTPTALLITDNMILILNQSKYDSNH